MFAESVFKGFSSVEYPDEKSARFFFVKHHVQLIRDEKRLEFEKIITYSRRYMCTNLYVGLHGGNMVARHFFP